MPRMKQVLWFLLALVLLEAEAKPQFGLSFGGGIRGGNKKKDDKSQSSSSFGGIGSLVGTATDTATGVASTGVSAGGDVVETGVNTGVSAVKAVTSILSLEAYLELYGVDTDPQIDRYVNIAVGVIDSGGGRQKRRKQTATPGTLVLKSGNWVQVPQEPEEPQPPPKEAEGGDVEDPSFGYNNVSALLGEEEVDKLPWAPTPEVVNAKC